MAYKKLTMPSTSIAPHKLNDTPTKASSTGSATSLGDLLDDGASLNAELRRQMDELTKTIHEIHENEVENQKLTKIKEEYKRRNQELMKENAKLKTENDRLRAELTSKVSKKVEELNEQLTRSELKANNHQQQFDFIDAQHKKMLDHLLNGEQRYRDKIEDTKRINEEKSKELEQITNEYVMLMKLQDVSDADATNLQQFQRQKQELVELAEQRARQVKLKDNENAALKQKIKQLQATVAALQDEKVSAAKMFPVKPVHAKVNRRRSIGPFTVRLNNYHPTIPATTQQQAPPPPPGHTG